MVGIFPETKYVIHALIAVHRVGEKFIQWTDKTPPLDDILDSVSLYWFTESFPRAIYGYRQFFDNPPQFFHNDKKYHGDKPMGYVFHPEELAPVPVSVVAKVRLKSNLEHFSVHVQC